MADVDAIITFLKEEGRINPVFTGYRPNHLITDDYLSSGTHYYYDREIVQLGETVLGTITFISPEVYPRSLWVGKKVNIQEGSKIVGYDEITKIFNQILSKEG